MTVVSQRFHDYHLFFVHLRYWVSMPKQVFLFSQNKALLSGVHVGNWAKKLPSAYLVGRLSNTIRQLIHSIWLCFSLIGAPLVSSNGQRHTTVVFAFGAYVSSNVSSCEMWFLSYSDFGTKGVGSVKYSSCCHEIGVTTDKSLAFQIERSLMEARQQLKKDREATAKVAREVKRGGVAMLTTS